MPSRTLGAVLLAISLAMFSGRAWAQPAPNPVYVDDSATATGALSRLPELLRAGNYDAAASQINHLLTLDGERLAPSLADPFVYVTVRVRCHETLAADKKLLERYRAAFSPTADELARQGQTEVLERSYLLTPAGLDAALDLAQLRLESAAFDAALLTLRALDGHPDLSGAAQARAAGLARELARYVTSPLASSLAERWGASPPEALVAWPADARRVGRTPVEPAPALEDPAALAKSLWTVPFGAGPSIPVTHLSGSGARRSDEPAESAPIFARALRIFPTVADDLIYVFDGVGVAAWDRFTLTRRWRSILSSTDPDADELSDEFAQRFQSPRYTRGAVPDPYAVTVRGRLLATASGSFTDDNNRDPPPAAVHLLEALSGRRLWTRRLGDLDSTLGDTVIRGPVMIDQGLVIFAARRTNPSRRLVSVYIAAIDAATGELRWKRLLGSAGTLPFNARSESLDGGVLADGVIYRGDQLGVFGAMEAHTGRPLWIRRFDFPATPNTDPAGSHQLSLPIIDGDSILTLSPNRHEVLRLDRATGAILGQRAIEPMGMGAAHYLVRVADRLALVGPTRIVTLPIVGFESAPARISPLFEAGIRGRVTAAGAELLVPLNAGLHSINAAAPDAPPLLLPLDGIGNVVPLGPQLVMVDDARLHNFLAWEPALKTLTERLDRDPADATAAVTLTELAYRSGRHESITPMLDRASAALAAAPTEPRNVLARRRLFEAMMSMAHASLEPAPDQPSPGAAAESERAADVRIADSTLLNVIITRADALASSPEERVAVTLVRGRSLERAGDPTGAAGEYQTVLADPALAGATWSGPRITIRGDIEATWRLERLVAEHGPQVYAPFDAQAAAELAQLTATGAPEPIQSLIDRFPLALVAPKAATALADALESRGKGSQAVRALETGLRAALRRADQDPAQLGVIVDRLATALEAREDLAAAIAVVRDAAARTPALVLPTKPTPTPVSERLADLQEKFRQSHHWPRIGAITTEGVQILPGWIVMPSDAPDPEPSSARCVAMENGEEISLWRIETGPTGPSLVKAWSMLYEERRIRLLRVVGDSAIFFISSPSRGDQVVRVSAATGAPQWTTPQIGKLFAGAPVPGDPEEPIVTPLDGPTRATEGLFGLDERTVVISDRAGRAAAFDLQSGQTLWFLGTPIVRLFDVSVRDGLVLLAGEQPTTTAGGATLGVAPGLMVLDARTGRQFQRIADLPAPIRWAAITESRQIVAGLTTSIVCYDALSPRINWQNSLPDLTNSSSGWFFGEQGYVIGEDRGLYLIDLARAQTTRRLEAPIGMFDEEKTYHVARIPAGVAFSGVDGIVIFNERGDKIGEDGLARLDESLPAAMADGMLVTADRGREEQSKDGLLPFNIRTFDTASAKLTQNLVVRLGANPRRIAAVEGMVILTAGHITLAFPAP